jgi:hypothetical protein
LAPEKPAPWLINYFVAISGNFLLLFISFPQFFSKTRKFENILYLILKPFYELMNYVFTFKKTDIL